MSTQFISTLGQSSLDMLDTLIDEFDSDINNAMLESFDPKDSDSIRLHWADVSKTYERFIGLAQMLEQHFSSIRDFRKVENYSVMRLDAYQLETKTLGKYKGFRAKWRLWLSN